MRMHRELVLKYILKERGFIKNIQKTYIETYIKKKNCIRDKLKTCINIYTRNLIQRAQKIKDLQLYSKIVNRIIDTSKLLGLKKKSI